MNVGRIFSNWSLLCNSWNLWSPLRSPKCTKSW